MTDPVDLRFESTRTALLLLDFQNFTIGLETAPMPAPEVLANAVRLADACRAAGILVVLVRVGHALHDVPHPRLIVDSSFSGFQFGPDAKEIPAQLGPVPGDVVVDKYNWGSFYGTNLDAHLRRRGITTLIVCGLMTHIAVDTTMRQAQERGYQQVLARDAAAAFTRAQHDFVVQEIAPRLARVRTTDEIVAALERSSLPQ